MSNKYKNLLLIGISKEVFYAISEEITTEIAGGIPQLLKKKTNKINAESFPSFYRNYR